MVFKVSPNWENIEPSKVNSSGDLSFAITQAREVIKLTNSQDPNSNTSMYHMKKRLSCYLNLFKKSIFVTTCIFPSKYITVVNTAIRII